MFSALFSEELGNNLQWRQRKGDYRFGISALFNIQAIIACNIVTNNIVLFSSFIVYDLNLFSYSEC